MTKEQSMICIIFSLILSIMGCLLMTAKNVLDETAAFGVISIWIIFSIYLMMLTFHDTIDDKDMLASVTIIFMLISAGAVLFAGILC